MKELEKLKYEIDLVSKGEHNQEFTGIYQRFTELYKALQLHKTQVSGSLIFGRMEISPKDKDGDFEICFDECYDGMNYKYINTEEAKQIADFFNAQL